MHGALGAIPPLTGGLTCQIPAPRHRRGDAAVEPGPHRAHEFDRYTRNARARNGSIETRSSNTGDTLLRPAPMLLTGSIDPWRFRLYLYQSRRALMSGYGMEALRIFNG